MKILTAPALLSIFLLGCGSGSKPAETVEANARSPVASHAGDGTIVTLDEAAQQRSGLVTVKVTMGNVAETLRVTGRLTLNENRTWRVGAITEGRVMKVNVNVGDRAVPNQVLASMHSHDVHEARALYQRAQSELSRALTNENQARRVRDRAKRLYDLKAASLEQLEHAETELRNMEAAVKQAEIELERTRVHLVDFLGVKLEAVGHSEEGKHGDEDLIPVKSPAEGVVIARNVTTGTVVQPGTEMFVITDLSTLWMIAAVPEEHLSRLRTNMPVQVTVPAHPGKTFRGRITKLGEQLDAATRTIQARIELGNAQGLLKPEMYGDAELELPGLRPAFYVPEHAIQEVKGNATVFVRRGREQFEAVAVETGRSANGMVEIRSTLQAGDEVVEKGAFLLKSQLLKSSLVEE
jgi:multidrug efflux pump subunit AcrA (membrane-fusion protein)